MNNIGTVELLLSMSTIDVLAHRVVQLQNQLQYDTTPMSPWLTAEEAAQRLRCPLSRIRKLTMQGALEPRRDGRRVLYRVDDLDKFVQAGGATT